MPPNRELQTLVEEYGLATGWDVRFVDQPGDPAAVGEALRAAGVDVDSDEARALAGRNRDIVNWLAADPRALRSFAADPRAAVEALDAGRRPPRPRAAAQGGFSAVGGGRGAALAQARGAMGSWALASSDNLRLLLRDPVQAARVSAHGRDPKEVRALVASLTRKPRAKTVRTRAGGR